MPPPNLPAAAFIAAAALLGAAESVAQTAQNAPLAMFNPPLAQSGGAPEIGDLLNLVDIGDFRGGFSLSPDGASAALVERRTILQEDRYQYDIVLVSLATGHATHIADAGGFLLAADDGRPDGTSRDRTPRWSPDGRRLAYLVGLDHQGALGVYDLEDASARVFLPGGGDVERFAWLDATTLRVTTSSNPQERHEQVEAVRANGFAVDDAYAPLFSPLPVHIERSSWRLDIRSGASHPTDDVEERAPAPQLEPGVRIAPLDASARAARPPLVVAYFDGSAEQRCRLQACRGLITHAWLSPDGADIVFMRREGFADAQPALYAWAPATDAVRLIRRTFESLIDCQLAAGALVCLQEEATHPRVLARIDLSTGEIGALYNPNESWRRFALPRVERIEAHDAFGEETFAHFVYPVGYVRGRRYPLVVVQYRSRGFLRGGVGGDYPIWPLAARGFAVLSVDRPEPRARRATLSAHALTRATALDGSENEMKRSGLEAMLDALDRRGLIDTRRIAITGLSDGAETAYYGLYRSDRFAVAAISSPPTDALDWFLNSEEFRSSRRANIGLTWPSPTGDRDWDHWWRQNAAVLHAEQIHAPLLMQLSDAEALSAFPLLARLRDLDRPVDLYIYPGEYHLKWRPRHIALTQTRALDWIEFWLWGRARADPVDADRLTRWRRLRERRGQP